MVERVTPAQPRFRAVGRVRGETADAAMAHIPYFSTKHSKKLLTASNKYLETNF